MGQPIYVSADELDTFHFHDACLEGIKTEGQALVWTVSALNVTSGNSQNPEGPDQCVDAIIRFEAGHISELAFPSYQQSIGKAKNVTVPEKRVPPQQFEALLKALAAGPCYILELEELKKSPGGHSACFLVDSPPGFLSITVCFRNVTVTWERFEGPAWYVNWP